jgi:hypothetical protein
MPIGLTKGIINTLANTVFDLLSNSDQKILNCLYTDHDLDNKKILRRRKTLYPAPQLRLEPRTYGLTKIATLKAMHPK